MANEKKDAEAKEFTRKEIEKRVQAMDKKEAVKAPASKAPGQLSKEKSATVAGKNKLPDQKKPHEKTLKELTKENAQRAEEAAKAHRQETSAKLEKGQEATGKKQEESKKEAGADESDDEIQKIKADAAKWWEDDRKQINGADEEVGGKEQQIIER